MLAVIDEGFIPERMPHDLAVARAIVALDGGAIDSVGRRVVVTLPRLS